MVCQLSFIILILLSILATYSAHTIVNGSNHFTELPTFTKCCENSQLYNSSNPVITNVQRIASNIYVKTSSVDSPLKNQGTQWTSDKRNNSDLILRNFNTMNMTLNDPVHFTLENENNFNIRKKRHNTKHPILINTIGWKYERQTSKPTEMVTKAHLTTILHKNHGNETRVQGNDKTRPSIILGNIGWKLNKKNVTSKNISYETNTKNSNTHINNSSRMDKIPLTKTTPHSAQVNFTHENPKIEYLGSIKIGEIKWKEVNDSNEQQIKEKNRSDNLRRIGRQEVVVKNLEWKKSSATNDSVMSLTQKGKMKIKLNSSFTEPFLLNLSSTGLTKYPGNGKNLTIRGNMYFPYSTQSGSLQERPKMNSKTTLIKMPKKNASIDEGLIYTSKVINHESLNVQPKKTHTLKIPNLNFTSANEGSFIVGKRINHTALHMLPNKTQSSNIPKLNVSSTYINEGSIFTGKVIDYGSKKILHENKTIASNITKQNISMISSNEGSIFTGKSINYESLHLRPVNRSNLSQVPHVNLSSAFKEGLMFAGKRIKNESIEIFNKSLVKLNNMHQNNKTNPSTTRLTTTSIANTETCTTDLNPIKKNITSLLTTTSKKTQNHTVSGSFTPVGNHSNNANKTTLRYSTSVQPNSNKFAYITHPFFTTSTENVRKDMFLKIFRPKGRERDDSSMDDVARQAAETSEKIVQHPDRKTVKKPVIMIGQPSKISNRTEFEMVVLLVGFRNREVVEKFTGTLVNAYWIISAASSAKEDMILYARSPNCPEDDCYNENVMKIYYHPDYIEIEDDDNDMKIYCNNIALLRLRNKWQYVVNYALMPTRFYQAKFHLLFQSCMSVNYDGYLFWEDGLKKDGNHLTKMRVTILQPARYCTHMGFCENDECASSYSYAYTMSSSIENGICTRDVGSPLFCRDNRKWILMGVRSSTNGCYLGFRYAASSYTRVDSLSLWINYTLGIEHPYQYMFPYY